MIIFCYSECRFFWAHFLRLCRKKPGYPLQSFLPPTGGAKKYFRFYPLRGQKSPSVAIFGFGVCASRKLHPIRLWRIA
jgi:hypothetical protein